MLLISPQGRFRWKKIQYSVTSNSKFLMSQRKENSEKSMSTTKDPLPFLCFYCYSQSLKSFFRLIVFFFCSFFFYCEHILLYYCGLLGLLENSREAGIITQNHVWLHALSLPTLCRITHSLFKTLSLSPSLSRVSAAHLFPIKCLISSTIITPGHYSS